MIGSRSRSLALWALAAAAMSLAAVMLAISARAATAAPKSKFPSRHALLASHELWATIDACNPPRYPNRVGVRGSMPGDGRAHDKLYMSFRLQYLDTAMNVWVDVVKGATPKFVSVGPAATARQGGTSFQLAPVPEKPAVTMRGVASFQWRRGKQVLLSATRVTTAEHKSLAGAEPKDFSAATCLIG
ncbi:MAG TPA: hypothetical protein VFY36_03695 [Solirubrobacteraceae bacterium]|nr:hypothetical protein [Solirubrobacteraceae bacterium]